MVLVELSTGLVWLKNSWTECLRFADNAVNELESNSYKFSDYISLLYVVNLLIRKYTCTRTHVGNTLAHACVFAEKYRHTMFVERRKMTKGELHSEWQRSERRRRGKAKRERDRKRVVCTDIKWKIWESKGEEAQCIFSVNTKCEVNLYRDRIIHRLHGPPLFFSFKKMKNKSEK